MEILWSTYEEHPLTAVQIGEKLKLYGIESERKSICRDINVLKDNAGIVNPYALIWHDEHFINPAKLTDDLL